LYPNPVNHDLFWSSVNSCDEVCIFNLQGQVVFKEKTQLNQGHLNVADLPAGMYILQLKKDDQVIPISWVKE
jgi:hypothetical protein